MRRLAWMMVSLLFAAGPVMAQDSPDKAKKPHKECRTEGRTGSRFSTSTCRTHEEWEAIDKEAAENAEKFVGGLSSASGRNGLSGGNLSGGPPQG